MKKNEIKKVKKTKFLLTKAFLLLYLATIKNKMELSMAFTTSQILKIVKTNRNTFQDWMDRKFIGPSIQVSSRQGEPNLFSLDDIYRIAAFQRLVAGGFGRKQAAAFINSFKKVSVKTNNKNHPDSDLHPVNFIVFKRWKVQGRFKFIMELHAEDGYDLLNHIFDSPYALDRVKDTPVGLLLWDSNKAGEKIILETEPDDIFILNMKNIYKEIDDRIMELGE